MSLIEKEAVIEKLDFYMESTKGDMEFEIRDEEMDFYKACYLAKKIITSMPSAQPEIIQCKDCKHWTHIKRTKRYWCRTDDGLYDLNPSPDDFCSRAERRTDG